MINICRVLLWTSLVPQVAARFHLAVPRYFNTSTIADTILTSSSESISIYPETSQPAVFTQPSQPSAFPTDGSPPPTPAEEIELPSNVLVTSDRISKVNAKPNQSKNQGTQSDSNPGDTASGDAPSRPDLDFGSPGGGEPEVDKPKGGSGGSDVPIKHKPSVPGSAHPTLPTSWGNFSTSSSTQSQTTTTETCTSLESDQPETIFLVLPNTNTVTVTVAGNYTSSLPPPVPEPSYPVYCQESSTQGTSTKYGINPTLPAPTTVLLTLPIPIPTPSIPIGTPIFFTSPRIFPPPAGPTSHPPVTFITTSKNPVTVTTTQRSPVYPGGKKTEKETVIPTPEPNPVFPTFGVPPVTNLPANPGGSPGRPPPPAEPIQFNPPNPTGSGGIFRETPVPTTIQGVPLAIAPSFVVIGPSTFAIGPGAPSRTITAANGQVISIGESGLGFARTTIAPPSSPTPQSAEEANQPTNVVIVDGKLFSVLGNSVAVFDGTRISFSAGSSPTITQFNSETITIGPAGVSFDGTTLGGPARTAGTQYGIAGGVSVTEIGSSVAVINPFTLTVGPGAVPSTFTLPDGHVVTAGSAGVEIGGTKLSYPFNPATVAVTAGGITFSEIGTSLVVIGGVTYTIGPGATPTSTRFNSQDISIGPGGVGFSSTTFTSVDSSTSSDSAPAETSKKKDNGAGRLAGRSLLRVCIAVTTIFIGILV